MVKQKSVSKAKEKSVRPKSTKRRRSEARIDCVKKRGELPAEIAGAIIAPKFDKMEGVIADCTRFAVCCKSQIS